MPCQLAHKKLKWTEKRTQECTESDRRKKKSGRIYEKKRRSSNTMHKKSKLKISYKCIMHINTRISIATRAEATKKLLSHPQTSDNRNRSNGREREGEINNRKVAWTYRLHMPRLLVVLRRVFRAEKRKRRLEMANLKWSFGVSKCNFYGS